MDLLPVVKDEETGRLVLADGEAIAGGRDDSASWGLILGLIEERRKLAWTERRHLADESRFVSVEQLMVFVAALTDIIRRRVADPDTRKKIADEVRSLAASNPDLF